MSTIVYACIVAGSTVFSDIPCDRPVAAMSEQNALAFAAIQDSPPRIPDGWGLERPNYGYYTPRWWRGAHYPSAWGFRRAVGPARGRR